MNPARELISILLVTILLCFRSVAESVADPDQLQWRDDAIKEIGELRDFSEREKARKVVGYLAMAGGTEIRFLSPHRSKVISAARKKLESMPGHAKFFEDELNALRDQRQQPTGTIDYNYQRQRIFGALRNLQTAETVDLLIRLLDDNRDAETIVGPGVHHRTPGNDEFAANALIGLIEELPLEKDRWGGYRLDVPALQAWGREVREGTRSYQFKGKPGTYDIHGRASVERREARSRPSSPGAGMPPGEEKPPLSSGARWAAAAAMLALLAAVAMVLRSPKRAG